MNKSKYIILLTHAILCLDAVPAFADTANPLSGTYYGNVWIDTPTALGVVDLALTLDVTGSSIQHDTSYIALENTLIYPPVAPTVPTVDGKYKEVGPRMTGTASSSNFSIAIDRITHTLSQNAIYKGGAGLSDAVVFRDITLVSTKVTDGGASVAGDYTEVVSGMDKTPVTFRGKFFLVKPSASSGIKPNQDGCIGLSEIKAGGSDPATVEYVDISQALHLYNNSSITPNICNSTTSRDQIINDALTNYYNALK